MVGQLCDFFFFNDTATTEIYTLSLHDALPIFREQRGEFLQCPGADEGDQLRTWSKEAPAPPDEPGERRNGPGGDHVDRADRSEEHTSELQSRQYLVCRLLLEKKTPRHETHSRT